MPRAELSRSAAPSQAGRPRQQPLPARAQRFSREPEMAGQSRRTGRLKRPAPSPPRDGKARTSNSERAAQARSETDHGDAGSPSLTAVDEEADGTSAPSPARRE